MKETFGSRLARLRKEHNFTQEDIANKINISAQAISKWENDLTSPDIQTLILLSDIFHVSLDELLGKEQANAIVVDKTKSIDKMMLKILVNSIKGDTVKVNLPVAIVKMFVTSGIINNFIKLEDDKKNILEGIDFNYLLLLIEQGIIGELVCVESANGDLVKVIVE